FWERVGYKNQIRAVIKNHKLDTDFKIDPIRRQVIFDGFRMTDDYFIFVYNSLKKFKIQYIQCYPSSGYEFCKFMDKKKLDTSFIKALLCSSENVLDYQRDFIEKKLGILLFSI